MKHNIAVEILRMLNEKKSLKRKLIWGSLAVVTCLFILSGLAIWATVSAVSFVGSSLTQAISAPATLESVHNVGADIKSEIKKLPKVHAAGCWSGIQSLMNPMLWLNRPPTENFGLLKSACLRNSENCKGEWCGEPDASAEGSNESVI